MRKLIVLGDGRRIYVSWLTLEELETYDDSLSTWYNRVKDGLDFLFSIYRPRNCFGCGNPVGVFDMHHGIVLRQDVRGWKYEVGEYDYKAVRLMLITNVLNCVPMCQRCHASHFNIPSRGEVLLRQAQFFGKDVLLEWLESLPWKWGTPQRFRNLLR